MLGLTGIPAVIELVLLPFFPESPRYMLIQKRDEKNSRKGRRLLLLLGFGICCGACVLLTVALNFQRGLGPYSFIIFSVICLVTLIYIWMVVPETKNKTFMEVFQMFAERNKTEIKVGDGDLPLKDSKESLESAEKITAF
ncbi:hypothetical protein GOODEAATRI_003124 [Goodea atripinnis]|uniref:Uncharacterized protein n=1 Tax=Goodea atripinnis TaxID=208336 RepID=A0ABV0N8I1_9TELE